MNLKQYIEDVSKKLNIDIIGFTDCEPFYELKDYLIQRIKEDKRTEFEEENIDRRINPKLIFPECKTIIAIGLSYNTNFDEKPDYKLKGILSRSSWGIDYHIVLKDRIERLIEEIEKVVNFKYQYYVDTGPLIDREIARKAGIGYYGKNCSIINYEYGSFIFLGYILTDLEIEEYSSPVEDRCGDCDLCLKACPTKALEGPYRLNPKRCLSYITQTKNLIPLELREKMGIRIYGCDTCQKVCPKNKGIKVPNHQEFIPHITKGYMDIEELLRISNRQFKEKYGSMSGSWRGKTILKRNGIIALGNMKRKENIDLLKPLLDDSNPMIREYVQWAINRICK